MADITNPQAVRFCNERLRLVADQIQSARRTGEQFLIEVFAFEDATSGNANEDVIIDGSATDGRPSITKQNVLEVKFVAEQLVSTLNQDDRETLVANVAVHGEPLF